jgi:hypothetical protein
MRAVLIEEQPDSLVFRLPNQRDLFTLILLPLLVCGFTIMMCVPLYSLLSGSIFVANPLTLAFLLVVALIAFTAFGAAGLYWIYNIFRINFGQEVLTVTEDILTLELKILRFSRCKTYLQSEVWQFRTIEKDKRGRYFRHQSYDLDQGAYTLAFDHNAGTAFLGASISEKGAASILEIICDKFPQYKPRDPATRHRWTPPRAS